MRPNELLQRLPHTILPVTCLFLHKFLLSSISLSVSLLFSLCSPSPVFHLTLLSSLPAPFCLSPPPLPFSDSLLLMPLLLRPAPLLFSHHHSLSLPPSFPPSILPPADGAWCDGDWLRDSQMEETAGMCFSGEKAARKDGGPWRDRRENG